MPSDLIAVIKQKQAEIAKLQAELDEARALLGGSGMFMTPHHGRPLAASKVKGNDRRTAGASDRADAIVSGSAADLAAQAVRAAGHPLHAHEMVKAIEQATGQKVKLATLVGSLSRWVKKKTMFYRAGRNVFGLIEMRKG